MDNRHTSVVSFELRSLQPQRKKPSHPLDTRRVVSETSVKAAEEKEVSVAAACRNTPSRLYSP
jgi:hypothetical protein